MSEKVRRATGEMWQNLIYQSPLRKNYRLRVIMPILDFCLQRRLHKAQISQIEFQISREIFITFKRFFAFLVGGFSLLLTFLFKRTSTISGEIHEFYVQNLMYFCSEFLGRKSSILRLFLTNFCIENQLLTTLRQRKEPKID